MSNVAALSRTTKNVFEHHLASFGEGLDSILSDYEETSVLLTPDATYRGLKEIRGFFDAFLKSATPEFWSAFKIGTQSVDGDIAYLTWSSQPAVALATDTLFDQGRQNSGVDVHAVWKQESLIGTSDEIADKRFRRRQL